MSAVMDAEPFWWVRPCGLINSGVSEDRIGLSSGKKKNVLGCLIQKEYTTLPHKDGKYLAGDNGITSQNIWIFISLCLPRCNHYANWRWNIWYLQDGFSDTSRPLSLSLISRAWIWSALYFSATKLILWIQSKISLLYVHYLLSMYIYIYTNK